MKRETRMRLGARLTDEDGFALATVLGAIAVITVIALGGFFVAENTLGEATRVGEENRAYQAASSGLEFQLQDFDASRFDAGLGSKSGYAYGTWQTINASDEYQVTVTSLGSSEYEMVSVGRSQESSETVRVRFMSLNLWDMNISGGEGSPMGSGSGFNGNGTIIGKVYCSGDFDWSGNGSIEGGPIFVRNGVFNKQSSGSNVGEASDPVATYFDNPPTGQQNNMYVEEKGSAPKLAIEFPNNALLGQLAEVADNDAAANLLGTDGSGTDGYVRHAGSVSNPKYNVFNGNLILGGTNFGKPGRVIRTAGTIDEANSGDVLAVSGNTLYVNGVTYIDGSLTISPSITKYMGSGVLVARDGVTLNGRLVPAGFDSGSFEMHDGTPMPLTTSDDCLGIVTMGDVTQNSADWVCCAIFAGGGFTATPTGARFRGSIIANGIDFNQPNVWLVTQPGLYENLPEAMPDLTALQARSDWIRQ